MATASTPRKAFPARLFTQLSAGIAALVALGNAHAHRYYLAGFWLIISLTYLFVLAGHRLPATGRRWALRFVGLGLLVAVVLVVLYARS